MRLSDPLAPRERGEGIAAESKGDRIEDGYGFAEDEVGRKAAEDVILVLSSDIAIRRRPPFAVDLGCGD